jgi:hypothetical protein
MYVETLSYLRPMYGVQQDRDAAYLWLASAVFLCDHPSCRLTGLQTRTRGHGTGATGEAGGDTHPPSHSGGEPVKQIRV